MLSRSCRPSGHPVSLERSRVELRAFLRNRDATTGRLTTAHDWRRHGSRSQAGGILVGATVAVSWLPYGEAPAGGVGRCCREAAARLGTPFRETIPGSSFAPWSRSA